MRTPDVELQWWEGCPSTERTLAELREALDELGLQSTRVRSREVKSEADAGRLGFVGSPTVLIDGEDAVAAAAGEPRGLTCRVYRRRDGAISPIPDPADLREALRRAAEREEVS